MIDPSSPAYPTTNEYGEAHTGLTIRQRYAMAAMSSIVKHGLGCWTATTGDALQNVIDNNEVIVTKAFELADAMIKFENEEKK